MLLFNKSTLLILGLLLTLTACGGGSSGSDGSTSADAETDVDAPTVIDVSDTAIEGGVPASGTVAVTDPDGDTLTYALTGAAPAGLTFNNDGSYSFDPTDPAYDSLAAGDTQDIVAAFNVTGDPDGSYTANLTITITGTFDPVVLDFVLALFTTNGANWNDYLAGSDFASATDTACTAGVDPACIHGGEIRVVEATGISTCTGLSASDDLGAFDWVCDDSTGSARLISTGLADGMFLSDLIDFTATGFKTNRVTVFDNGAIWGISPGSTWWSNTVETTTPAAPANLDSASTIYLQNADATGIFVIGSDKVSLVIEPGVTLSGPGLTSTAVIDATNHSFLWLEGSIDAAGDQSGIVLTVVHHSMLRNVSTGNGSAYGIHFDGANNNTLSGITANDNTYGIYVTGLGVGSNTNTLTDITASSNSQGVYLLNARFNTLTGITANNNVTHGVNLEIALFNTLTDITANNNPTGVSISSGSNNNTLSGVTVNNSTFGVFISSVSNNTLSGITASNNNVGVYLSSASNNTLSGVMASSNDSGVTLTSGSRSNILSNITASNNQVDGVNLQISSGNNTLSGVTASNNVGSGVTLSNSQGSTLSGITASNNNVGVDIRSISNNTTLSGVTASNNLIGIALSTNNNRATGLLKVGNNSGIDCQVSFGFTNPGLVDTTCANDVGAGSDATLTTGITLANSFIGKVIVDDTQNSSDGSGSADFIDVDSAFDWLQFDNAYRGWGIDGLDFPDDAQRGRWITGIGRIWDWSLSAGDTVVRELLVLPTGDDFLTHSWYNGLATPANDSDCNLIIATDSIYNGGTCETTYLHNAAEILGDDIGNDNGLCESNESCLYAPNIGSYQGHGVLVSAGAFTPGTLTGITLMRFENNGR